MIDRTAQHHAIEPCRDMITDLRRLGQPAVQYHDERRPLLFQPVHVVVLERRNLTILLGRQAAQYRRTGVHDERIDSDACDRLDEGREERIIVAIINADAAFDGHRQRRGVPQGPDAIGHQLRVKNGSFGACLMLKPNCTNALEMQAPAKPYLVVTSHRANYNLGPMKRLQAFKYELMPNGEQQRHMRQYAGCCRFVYNKALALQKAHYEAGGQFIGYVAMAKHLTAWRHSTESPWLKDAPVHPLQQKLKDLE